MLEFHLIAFLLATPSALKCQSTPTQMPGYEARQPVMLIDGVVVPHDLEGLGDLREDIASIEIRCWNPATDSFGRNGINVVVVYTKTLIDNTRAPLLALVRAQEEYRSSHRRYATSLQQLETFGLDVSVAVELEASESGWKASTPSDEVAYRCTATEASAGTVDENGEPMLDCVPVDTLALRSLRARYDAGR